MSNRMSARAEGRAYGRASPVVVPTRHEESAQLIARAGRTRRPAGQSLHGGRRAFLVKSTPLFSD